MPDAADTDKILPLQEWLKLLASNGVPMRLGMQLAAKGYKGYNTREKLSSLKSGTIDSWIEDKDQRKLVVAAVRNISAGKATTKKRSRDADLMSPLKPEAAAALSFEFNEILDPEQLLPVSVTVNRAPVKTAWAYSVARRRGFDVEESLSLAHVYVHIGSLKHALALGNILDAEQTKDAEEEIRELPGEADYRRPYSSPQKKRRGEVVEKAVGSSQPWVGLLKSKLPVIEREDGTWRALQKGIPVEPSQAYLYITRALKGFTGHVMGAMKLVVDSYSPEEIDVVGLHLYNAFKPDVTGWGQRGSVDIAKILDQLKEPLKEPEEAEQQEEEGGGFVVEPRTPENPSSVADAEVTKAIKEVRPASEVVEEVAGEEPPAKRRKDMTVEEYEEMLDGDEMWDEIDLSGIP